MSIKWGKREIDQVSALLESGDYPDATELAKGALGLMEELFEKRAKYTVVGQLESVNGATIHPSDEQAVKVALGWYSTHGDAVTAAESLWRNTGAGETFRVWVLPVHHGTPSSLHTERNRIAKAEAAQRQKDDDKFKATMNTHRKHLEETVAAA